MMSDTLTIVHPEGNEYNCIACNAPYTVTYKLDGKRYKSIKKNGILVNSVCYEDKKFVCRECAPNVLDATNVVRTFKSMELL